MAKFLDKMKSIFFEEEEIEEVEVPKKEPSIAKKIDVVDKKEVSENTEKEEVLTSSSVITEKELIKEENNFKFPMMFEENDFASETLEDEIIEAPNMAFKEIESVEKVSNYTKVETIVEDKPHLYEKKVENLFRASPIISPVYGVLDKNYKKEEIVTKREVKISARSSNVPFDVDSVRNKAYGDLVGDILNSGSSLNSNTDLENTLYDITKDNTKVAVDKITIGDAEEYFEDLGLEYNIDYKDNMKERATGRRSSNNEAVDFEDKKVVSKDEKLEDNLFDLIESMYNKED